MSQKAATTSFSLSNVQHKLRDREFTLSFVVHSLIYLLEEKVCPFHLKLIVYDGEPCKELLDHIARLRYPKFIAASELLRWQYAEFLIS